MQLFHMHTLPLLFLVSLPSTLALPTDTSGNIPGAPAEANARLYELKYSGSGCPQGSASVQYDPAISASRPFFSAISASTGPGVGQDQSRENCELMINLQSDPGWKFTIKQGCSLTAYVNLKDGVSASYITTYNIAGAATVQGLSRYDYSGPRSGSVTVADPEPGSTYPVSKCGGGILSVDRSVQLSSSTDSAGSVSLPGDTGSGPLNSNFVPWGILEWRRC